MTKVIAIKPTIKYQVNISFKESELRILEKLCREHKVGSAYQLIRVLIKEAEERLKK